MAMEEVDWGAGLALALTEAVQQLCLQKFGIQGIAPIHCRVTPWSNQFADLLKRISVQHHCVRGFYFIHERSRSIQMSKTLKSLDRNNRDTYMKIGCCLKKRFADFAAKTMQRIGLNRFSPNAMHGDVVGILKAKMQTVRIALTLP